MLSILTLAIEFFIKAFIHSTNPDITNTDLLDWLFILIYSIVFLSDISQNSKIRLVSYPVILGYIWRIFLLLFDRYGRSIFTLPNSNSDSEEFFFQAVKYATTHHTSRGAFPTFMGAIFSVIGTSRVYGQFIILLFSMVSLCLVARIVCDFDVNKKNKQLVMCIISLLPNWAILSIVFMRESIVSMFVSLSIYQFYRWFKNGGIIKFCLSFVFILFAARFHSGTIAVALGYITTIMLYDRKNKKLKIKAKNIIAAMFLLFFTAFLFINYADVFFAKMLRADSISDIANMHEEGGSSYAKYVGNSNNPINMIIYTPLRIIFFLFSPFPWQIRKISDVIAFFFSSMFYIYASYCIYKYLKSGRKRNRVLIVSLAIIVFCTVFVFAWGVANTGTACRHRDKLVPIWGLLLCLTYNPKKNNLYIQEKH